jgi:hypothetical protein
MVSIAGMILQLLSKKEVVNIIGMSGHDDRNGWSGCAGLYKLLIELLGGVRIDTLDRMRITMKVTVVNRKHAGYLGQPRTGRIISQTQP